MSSLCPSADRLTINKSQISEYFGECCQLFYFSAGENHFTSSTSRLIVRCSIVNCWFVSTDFLANFFVFVSGRVSGTWLGDWILPLVVVANYIASIIPHLSCFFVRLNIQIVEPVCEPESLSLKSLNLIAAAKKTFLGRCKEFYMIRDSRLDESHIAIIHLHKNLS